MLVISFIFNPVFISTNYNSVYAINSIIYEKVKISSGVSHNVILDSDGTVWVWGGNNFGQLGDGTSINKTTPAKLDKLIGVVDIAAGGNTTLVLKDDGSVWACGLNNFGQLGIGTNAGFKSCQWLRWGDEFTNAIWIAAGGNNTAAVKNDGTVWVCGDNAYGQLGNEDIKTLFRWTPRQVNGLTDVIAVAAGTRHMIALKKDGTVWGWGNYDDKQKIGYGGSVFYTDPNGTPRQDFYMEYPDKSYFKNIPVQMEGLTDVIAISAGAYYSVALKNDGTVWAWGRNNRGQLGTGMYETEARPYKVAGITDVIAIYAGSDYTVALKKDGTIWAWGCNNTGQLGDGTKNVKTIPIQVKDLADAIGVAAGGRDEYVCNSLQTCYAHTIALKKDGTIWAWGSNDMGKLGNGSIYGSTVPIEINNVTLTLPVPEPVTGTAAGQSEASMTVDVMQVVQNLSDWAKPELQKAVDADLLPVILKGTDMKKPISREEFCELAVKIYEKITGKQVSPVNPNPFSDTDNQQILKAFTLGITSGISATTFQPDTVINREQCAVMLFRVIKAIKPNGDYSTGDVKGFQDQEYISSWAVEATMYMSKIGVIFGDRNANFMPKAITDAQKAKGYGMATREQAILLAIRTFEILKQ